MRSEKEILQAIEALRTNSPDGEPEVYIENIRSFIVALQWVLEGENLTSRSSRAAGACAYCTDTVWNKEAKVCLFHLNFPPPA